MKKITVLSLFPKYFCGPFDESIVGRAQKRGIVDIQCVDIRDFATDKHRRVDDRPYGGGPGMVLMPGPTTAAIRAHPGHVVFLSPEGSRFDTEKAKALAQRTEPLTFLCGHYEGIDQRVLDSCVHETISVGDFVLSNGCIAAIVVIDALLRFVPGVLGHEDAAAQDSFEDGLLDCPHYSRPEDFEGLKVPDVLLSGDHEKIRRWRRDCRLQRTQLLREDLYRSYFKKEILCPNTQVSSNSNKHS